MTTKVRSNAKDSIAFLKERAIEHQKRLRRLEIGSELAQKVQQYFKAPSPELKSRIEELSAQILE